MKQQVADIFEQALSILQQDENWPEGLQPSIQIERCKDERHGDFACNLAMMLAKPLRSPPRAIAERIVAALPDSEWLESADIAGPGFINIRLRAGAAQALIQQIIEQGSDYGLSASPETKRLQVEFVSANPTGPLHVGHGRGAAYGACVANLLASRGHDVEREYYVNDAGRQMDILASSVWVRYLQQGGCDIPFPDNGYQGEYIKDYASRLRQAEGDSLQRSSEAVLDGLPADASAGGDKEQYIDALIERAKALLGDAYQLAFNTGLEGILADIRQDLAEFGVEYQHWFSERSLSVGQDQVSECIEALQSAGYIEERDGALWFLSTQFGDDKDRVVRRDNGQTTYFASDIAYHRNKFQRGFDQVINIWGADHHGYIARVKAALQALNINPERLQVRLVQFVSLYRGEEALAMSTRSGSFVTLRELREEVGNDAARFFYIMRKADQPTDFDLELAKAQTKDNPVYYIQYAHARICSVMNKLSEAGHSWDHDIAMQQLGRLDQSAETELIKQLSRYPEVLCNAADQLEPHALAQYLKELASQFHAWYNGHKVIVDDQALRDARVALCKATGQVIANGLTLLGVSAPESM